MVSRKYMWNRWARLEFHLWHGYAIYWVFHTSTRKYWLLKFNWKLCKALINLYVFVGTHTGYPKRPPVFKAWYVKLCHKYMTGGNDYE
jgi:hypothetical protein